MIQNLAGIYQDDFFDNTKLDSLKDLITSQADAGQNSIVVNNGSLFGVGKLVIVYDGYEIFETAVIQSISGNVLTMTENLLNTYPEGSYIGKFLGVLDTVNKKYLRLQSPDLGNGSDGAFVSVGNESWVGEKNFSSVLVKSGHTIYVNGNFSIKCQGNFEIEAGGKITAEGYGHAGGWGTRYNAYNGASEIGGSTQSWMRNGGGGGGGYASGSSSSRSCGGGGGYGGSGGSGYTQYSSPNNTPQEGSPYNDSELSRFELAYLKGSGGGGGASAESNGNARGGNGGGIIRIHCRNLIVNGEIDCDGENAPEAGIPSNYNTGGGGGGAGGTIFIQVLNKATLGVSLVHANGGAGSGGKITNGTIWGYGGNGSGGRIRIEAGKKQGSTSPGYATNYYSNVGGYAKFGWYFTKEIKALNPTITINGFFKQEAIVRINLSSIANSGQANISLTSALAYEVGDKAIIYENEKMEIVEIIEIIGNVLTLASNLQNSYSTSAQLIRVDAYGYVSLEPAGDNENLQEMMLQSATNLGSNIWYLAYSKTIKAINGQDSGVRVVGCVKLKGRSNSVDQFNLKEANWNYF